MIQLKKNYDEMWSLGWSYWKVGLLVYAAVAFLLAVVVGIFSGIGWAVVAWCGLFILFLVFWFVAGLTDGWSHDHSNEVTGREHR